MANALGWLAMYQTFSTNHLSYTKTLVPIYRFRAITFFLWCRQFLETKCPFCPKIKQTLSGAVFRVALIVAPLFLDICLEIFGAWINQKTFFWGTFLLENKAFLAKSFF